MLFLGIISWIGASRFNGGGGCFSDGRGFIFKCPMPPWPPPHPGSEELKKCPPPSTAVQRIADAVREKKPR